MNPVVTLNRVNFYNDMTRNARFSFAEINQAVNDAIYDFIDEQLGDPLHRDPNNFQFTQMVRENLYNLIKTAALTPTNGTVITNRYYSVTPSHVNFPADYYSFLYLSCTIDGYTDYARPTTYNEKGPLLKDAFRHPTNLKTYFNEDSTGLVIFRGTGGTFSTTSLDYVRNTTDFTIGTESNLINAGGTLTNAVTYYATEISVYNGVTYAIGATITGTGAALTSGQVLPTSVTSPIDLPDKTHETICRNASKLLLGVTANFPQSQFSEKAAS